MSQSNSIAQVVSVRGSAFAISRDGQSRRLKVGDTVAEQEAVVTSANGELILAMPEGREIRLGQGQRLVLDEEVTGSASAAESALPAGAAGLAPLARVLNENQPLDALIDEEAPAAGQAGPGSEGGHSFVEFSRIVEQIAGGGASYVFGAAARGSSGDNEDEPSLLLAPTPAVPDTTPPNGGAAPTVVITEDTNNDGFINRQELQGEVDVRIGFDPARVDVGDVVKVSVDGRRVDIVVDAQAKASGYVDLAVTPPVPGSTLGVSAVIVDPAGNSTPPGRDSAKIDTSNLQGLKVTIVEDSNGDGFINKSELQGQVDIRIDLPPEAIAGDLLSVRISGQPVRTFVLTQAEIDTGYTMTALDAPANGTRIEVSAQVSDPAGNQSNTGFAAATVMIGDVKAPTVVIAEDANRDGYINAAELRGDIDVFIGLPDTARAGDLLLVRVNGTARLPILLTAADIANGQVALSGIASPGDGNTLSVAAQLRDPAGNLSPNGEASAIIDTTVFADLGIRIVEDSNNDGFIAIAELRDNDIDVRVTLPRGAAVGDSLTVSASGNVDQVVTLSAAHLAAGYIDFKFNPTADNTDFVATARIVDNAGNSAGPVSDSARLMLSEPGAPIVTLVEDRNNDGWINAAELQGGIDVGITLPGTANAGDSLLVSVNGSALAPRVLTLDDIRRGSIELSVASPGEGQRIEVSAQVSDPAGNLGKPGRDSAIVDTLAPNGGAAPTVVITEDANNDGFINRQELQGNVDVRIGFDPAKVDVGDVVRVSVDGRRVDIVVDAQAKANGYVDLAVTPPVPGSTLAVSAVIVDPAGNSTPPGRDSAKIDTSNLQGLKVTIVEDSNGDGFINKAELQGQVDIRIDLPPEAIAGDLLSVRISGQPVRTFVLTQAEIDTGYTMTALDAPANGTRIEVSAQVSDPAGNQSNTGFATATVMIGDVKAPTVVIAEDANRDGYINAAELRGDIDVFIGLPDTARAGDLLLVRVNGTARLPILLTAADIANGQVALSGIASPGDGNTLSVAAQLRDPAGNLSPNGEASAIIDTTVFADLGIRISEDSNNDGFIAIAELRDNDIDVRVTLPRGAAVGDSLTVSASGNVDQVVTLSAAHLAAGYIDFKFNPSADNTDFVATARIVDNAGNSAGPVSDSARLMLSEPGAPIVTLVEDRNNDGWINAAELQGGIDVSITLPGTANAGDSLLVSVNGSALAPRVLTLDDIRRGSIELSVASPGEGQRIEVSAQVSDPAGNLGKPGRDSAIVDTLAPNGGAAPTVVITEDTNNDGFINRQELQGDVDVRISFDPAKVDVGDVVRVSVDGGRSIREITIAAADKANGFVTVQYPPQADGSTIKVEAWLADPAGNTTPRAADQAVFATSLSIADLTISVSEEGLAHGIKDNLPNPNDDLTDDAFARGSLNVVNGGAALGFTLLAPSEELCSNGVRIVWSGDGSEASPLIGRAGPLGPEVICARIDAQGNYDVRLLGPVDHPNTGAEDVASLNFTVRASDGSQQAEAQMTLRIEDDAPFARTQEIRVGQGDGVDSNLLVVLDVSASMRQDTGLRDLNGQPLSRLDLAKLAIRDLLDRHEALGEVMVRLVIFGNDAQAIGARWLSVAEARAALDGIEAGNDASNYDAALLAARAAYADAGRLAPAQNVSYFFSDGEPTIDSSGHPFNYPGQYDPFLGDGIDRDEEAQWRAFLEHNDMTSHAVGVGPRTFIIPNPLNPIAWDGAAETDLNAYWIGDFNEMACVFAATIGGATTLDGSLGGFGADGGHVAVVDIGGYRFAYDALTNTLAVSGSSTTVSAWRFDPVARALILETSVGERIELGLCDGSYSYHTDVTPPRGHRTEVRYTLVDGDGDQASGALGFIGTGETIPPNQAPVTGIEVGNNLLGIIGLDALDLIDLGTRTRFSAFDADNNMVKLEIAYRSLVNLGPYHLKASHALAEELGLNLDIVNDPGLLGLLLPSSTLVITAKDGGTLDNLAVNELLATVHYEQSLLDLSVLSATSITATDSQGLSNSSSIGSLAEVGLLSTPDQDGRIVEGSAQDDALSATEADSRLYGYDGDDVLVASAGSDLLRGGSGNDSLQGEGGNDLLIGGQGNDRLWGGAGSDVFRWEFGDQGTVTAPAVDRIADFNLSAAVGAGGDVLDLRDLLQGEYHDGSDPGNLTQYLHFETRAEGTVIHINPKGDGAATTQQIVLEGVDFSQGGLLAGNTQIIQNLLQQGKLLVD